jgi:hypothetical protein
MGATDPAAGRRAPARARLTRAPVETMNGQTAHEFYAKHPNAKSFPSMKEARAWQDQHGGNLWHLTPQAQSGQAPRLARPRASIGRGAHALALANG